MASAWHLCASSTSFTYWGLCGALYFVEWSTAFIESAALAYRRFNRRGTASSFAALLASVSASAAGAYNFWFRFPGIPELLTNRWFVGYVVATFLFGMAVSYYWDNNDAKLIDILDAALRLCGTGMVFYSLSQLWELAVLATAALILATTFVLPRVRAARRLSLTGAALCKAPHVQMACSACHACMLWTLQQRHLLEGDL